jgi:lysophospholipase
VENGTPIYEYTPYEFGTWDASNTTDGGYFTPVEWLGSDPNNNTCYRGYDQMSFIVGVSATLFNAIPFPVTQMFPNTTFPFLNASTANVATVPNPFEGYNGSENPDPNDTQLTLVDAGETNQNLPLLPLIVPARKVDAIIALDASNDVNAWPNGAALYTTYTEYENNTEFMMPAVPSPNGFINGGFNTRPTFFGCNDTQGPLVVYIPNYPYSALTNITTMTLQQATNLTDDQLRSSLKTVTLNGTVGAWPTCLACALTDRANNYSSASRSANCAKCFDAFCWNGEDNTTAPAAYYPAMGVPSFLQNLNLTLDATTPDNAASAVAVGKAFAVVAAGAAVWIAL